MEIHGVVTTGKAGRARGSAGPTPDNAKLLLGSDRMALTHRDGAASQPIQADKTPGVHKLALGGGLFALCTIGLGFSLAAAASAPLWVPLLFGAGVLVGGGIALKGATEFAHYLRDKMSNAAHLDSQP